MSLVDDDGEPLAGQRRDLVDDDREFLKRGHDDGLAGLQRLFELAGCLVYVLDHAEGLFELPYGALQLAVEHTAVRDHDDRVEDPAVLCVVKDG